MLDFQESEVVAMVGHLARKEHTLALDHLTPCICATMKFGAGVGDVHPCKCRA